MMQCKVYTLSIPPSSCDSHFGRRFAASATIYGRYKFVQKLAQLMRVSCPRLNTAALVIGMLSCFGMCVVATFQVSVHACSLWNTQSLKNTLNAFAYFHLFRCISGNNSGKCPSSWSPALLCIWGSLYDPPMYYIMLYFSVWSVRYSLQSACQHDCNSRVGVSVEYPFILPARENTLSFSKCVAVIFSLLPSLIDNSAVIFFFLRKWPPLHHNLEEKVRLSPSQQQHDLVSNGFDSQAT